MLPWIVCADDNVFLASRILRRNPNLLQNPDPGPSRFTSLAWAAACANEEMFDFLLSYGHDDEYLSRVRSQSPLPCCPAARLCYVYLTMIQSLWIQDSENNTILCLLAGVPPDQVNACQPSTSSFKDGYRVRAALSRMTSAYQDRYPFLVDWANEQGKTPLHLAAISGNDTVVDVSQSLLGALFLFFGIMCINSSSF